ncbi:MAG: YlxR family protein [Actinobacteria bacterium]|nr:YlxR family protein [Actinomycetota bacterium]MBO0787634.1 YlxR family protein [Actinomycetota bacterium]
MTGRSLRPVPSGPVVRTCIGCRASAAKSDLLRVVASGDEVVPDPRARLPGRGAYLHPSHECFEQAQRRRAFPRALRVPGPVGTGRLGEYLAGLCDPHGPELPLPEGTGR